jgi:aryl-alcohol dehydrogenase-like predicted oxidoreductase
LATYFLHSPDHDTPIEETVDAIQELYAAGKFKKVRIILQALTQWEEISQETNIEKSALAYR